MRCCRTPFVIAGFVTLGPASLSTAQVLDAAIDRAIADQKLPSAQVGVYAIDLRNGSVLASLRSAEPLIPASNMKLLTSGAALDVLGESFAFRTELILQGQTLVLRGSGDPSLGIPEVLDKSEPRMTVAEFLTRLAASVKEGGVTRIDSLVVDDTVFDRELIHPAWEPDDLTKAYAAPICGVNFHANVVTVYPSPSGAGRAPTVVLEPESPWIEVINRAKTANGKSGGSCWITRDPSREVLTLSGEVTRRVAIEAALHDPVRSAGRLLAGALLRAGVAVGPVPSSTNALSDAELGRLYAAVRPADSAHAPAQRRTLAVIATPIPEILRRCNADSSNLDAECLLKRLGHEVTRAPGSWANGASVIRMRLTERLGPEYAAEAVISDGSGLSRENRVSARTLARWLEAQAGGEHAAAYINSLASPGEGTLRRRFRAENVSLRLDLCAKSGSIEGVRCLSGYLVDPASGTPRIAFSILVNGLNGAQTQPALRLHERIVAELDSWAAGTAAAVDGG